MYVYHSTQWQSWYRYKDNSDSIINSYNVDKSTWVHTFLAEVEQAQSWPKHPLEAEAYPRVVSVYIPLKNVHIFVAP